MNSGLVLNFSCLAAFGIIAFFIWRASDKQNGTLSKWVLRGIALLFGFVALSFLISVVQFFQR